MIYLLFNQEVLDCYLIVFHPFDRVSDYTILTYGQFYLNDGVAAKLITYIQYYFYV